MKVEHQGTKEWANRNINIGIGCSHECLYCYARSFALWRKAIKKRADWANEQVLIEKVNKTFKKMTGNSMFPSTHDITPNYLPHVKIVLQKMLDAGNDVLLVSKPHLKCIEELCLSFEKYKDQILFRFTIGTMNPKISKFWEPGAPEPAERLESLKHAFKLGFKTSVSCEPMLEGVEDVMEVFNVVVPFVTNTIWIGKMNRSAQRVGISNPAHVNAVKAIKEFQSDSEILRLVYQLQSNPKVEWKDSIKKVIENI